MKSKILLVSLSLAFSISSWGQALYVPGGFSALGIGTSSVADNVGIGIASPINILDVNGIARFRRQGSPTAGATLGGDALALRGWGANNPYIEWRNSTDVRQGYMGWNTSRLSLVMENGYNFTIENGNVGIGTSTPSFNLDVAGTIRSNGYLRTTNVGVGGQGYFADDAFGSTVFSISRQANNETRIQSFGFHTFFSGGSTGTEKMRIASDGNVGIGTTNPNQKLTVNGTIYGKEVKVDLSVPGPDYVFANNYQLPTLTELKTYIDQNKHLPEVPSAEEMEANGINLGEMNILLLKKVEELTLYILEQEKRINKLENK